MSVICNVNGLSMSPNKTHGVPWIKAIAKPDGKDKVAKGIC